MRHDKMNRVSFSTVIFVLFSILHWSRAQTSGINRECSNYNDRHRGDISKPSEGIATILRYSYSLAYSSSKIALHRFSKLLAVACVSAALNRGALN